MKKFLSLALSLLLMLQLFPAISLPASAAGTLTVYPEYPADSLNRDYMYTVTVSDGTTTARIPVYNDSRHANHYQNPGSGDLDRRWCEFAFEGTVTVSVQVNCAMTSYTVIPASANVANSVNGSTVTLTLTEAGQYALRLNDNNDTTLSIFADAPETDVPDPTASTYTADGETYNIVVFDENNVAPASIQRRDSEDETQYPNFTYFADTAHYPENTLFYFAAGVHDVPFLGVESNQKVYFAPGALVNTRVQVNCKSDNTEIFGRGVLRDYNDTRAYNSTKGLPADTEGLKDYPLFGYPLTIGYGWNTAYVTTNNTVRDIKVLDSKSFCVVYDSVDLCTMDNVKIIANEISTDGITFFCQSTRTTIKNCYINVCDNLFVLGNTSSSEGLVIRDCLLATSINLIFGQAKTGASILFQNLDVFRCNVSFLSINSGYTNNGHAITVNNLSMVDCVSYGSLASMGSFNSGDNTTEKTFYFNNVALPDGAATVNMAAAESNTYAYGNAHLNISNLYVGGEAVTYSGSGTAPAKLAYTPVPDADISGKGAVASSLKVTNDGSYTPPTSKRRTYSATPATVNIGSADVSYPFYGYEAAYTADGATYLDLQSLAELFGFTSYTDSRDGSMALYDDYITLQVTETGVAKNGEATAVVPALKNGRFTVTVADAATLFGVTANGNYLDNYARTGENLLAMGDCESVHTPAEWTTTDFTPITHSTKEAHSGTGSLLMRPYTSYSYSSGTVATGWRGGYASIYDTVTRYGTGTYTLSFWAKCGDSAVNQNAEVPSVIVGTLSSGYNIAGSSTEGEALTTAWKQYSFPLTVSAFQTGYARLQLGIAYKGVDKVYIDDISFTKNGSGTAPTTAVQSVVTFTGETVPEAAYTVGTVFEKPATLTATYNDGTTAQVSDYTLTYDFSTPGDTTVSYTLGGKTVSYPTTVKSLGYTQLTEEDGLPIGANIRVDPAKSTGIRFGITVQKGELFNSLFPDGNYAYTDTVQFGTLLIPTDLLGGKTLPDYFIGGGEQVLDIPAEKLSENTATSFAYTGVLVDIPDQADYYDWQISAAFYVRTRETADDAWHYSFFPTTDGCARSLYDVAKYTHDNYYNEVKLPNPTEEQKYKIEALYDIINAVDGGGWIIPGIWY